MIEILDYDKTPLDVGEIQELFFRSFNQQITEEYWSWRFKNNPNSEKVYIVYAKDADLLVAYYAVSPVRIQTPNGERMVALSNMTMTHPDYQGRGLFKQLANRLFDLLKEDQFDGVFGFANNNSHYGFRKNLGWTDISVLNVLSCSSDQFRSHILKVNESFDINLSTTEKSNLSAFDSFSRTKQPISTVLDSDVYHWRFNSIPNKTYKCVELSIDQTVLGHVVFKEFGDDIDIMEYWYKENNWVDKNTGLIHILNFIFKNYSGSINIWSNIHSSEHLILEKFGFQETHFNSYFGFIPFTDNVDYLQLSNWHYRFTDSDIF